MNIFDFQVPKLTSDNYKIWKEKILLQLRWIDVNDAIRKEEPLKPIDTSSAFAIALYECWERSNHLNMMYIKTKIFISIHWFIGEHQNVKKLLKAIDEQFETSNKALASTLMTKLSSMKLTSIRSVQEHIM